MTVADRRAQERQERRHLILDAAERVFYEKGPETATMEDVATEARLGKGTLYLYFRNRDDLRMGVAVRHQERLLRRMDQARADAADGLDELRRLLLAYAEHMASSVEHLKMVLGCWVAGAPVKLDSAEAQRHVQHIRRTFGVLCDAILRGRADGTIRAGPPAPPLALQLWAFVNGSLLLRLQERYLAMPGSLRELDPSLVAPTLPQAVEACLDGLRVRPEATESEPAPDSSGEPGPVGSDDGAERDSSAEPRAAAPDRGAPGGARC